MLLGVKQEAFDFKTKDFKNKYIINMQERQFENQESMPQYFTCTSQNIENTMMVAGFSSLSYNSPQVEEMDEEVVSYVISPQEYSFDQYRLFDLPNCEELELPKFTPPAKEDTGPEQVSPSNPKKRAKTDSKKNSNTIKKYGRLILDHLKEYEVLGKTNVGLENMQRLLSRKSRVGRSEVNKRDKFNTFHLKAMVETGDLEEIAHNLRTTRKILNKHLRSNVLESRQIDSESKLIYMNTLKCCSLRCSNKKLAVRLQIANEKERQLVSQ